MAKFPRTKRKLKLSKIVKIFTPKYVHETDNASKSQENYKVVYLLYKENTYKFRERSGVRMLQPNLNHVLVLADVTGFGGYNLSF